MADTKPPDYEKYTRGVAREAQAYNKRAAESDREAIGESRGFEAMARANARAAKSRPDPEYMKLEQEERASRRKEIRNRTRAGRGDWTRSVSLRKSKRR